MPDERGRGQSPSLSVRFELERMRQRMNTGEPCPVLIGRDGRFALERLLGSGGMGDVYLARDTVLQREVAVKVIAARFLLSLSLRHQLLREARSLAAARHPNVLEVYDVDTSDSGELFLTMAYVPGRTLQAWQKGQPWQAVLSAYLSAGRGLAAAHGRRIVHRDFKPGNVMFDERHDSVLVADFGLAGAPSSEEASTGSPDSGQDGTPRPSATSKVMGTPRYMAPELFAGQAPSFASDQYSFCVALWEGVVGATPFPGPREPDVRLPPQPSAMPAWLYGVLRRGLSAAPDRRFASMDDLLAAIVRKRRRRRLLVLTAVSAAALAAFVMLVRASANDAVDCGAAVAAIDAIWNDDTRRRVEDTLTRGESGSDQVARYALTVLDTSAERWRHASAAACEAHRAAPLDHRRMVEHACHARWLTHFARRIEVLEQPGPSDITRYAHDLLAPFLRPGEECRLPRPLLQDDVQAALGRAEEAEALRDPLRALASARDALASSEVHGQPCVTGQSYSPERGEALYRMAHIHGLRESPAEAVAALDEAATQAMACDYDELLARVQVLRAQVTALDLEQPESAEQAITQADALYARLGGAGTQTPELDKARAFVALIRGRPLDAVRWYRSAIAALGDDDGTSPGRGKLLADVGAALQEYGDFAGAEQAYRQSVALVSESLGPEHPESKARAAHAAFNIGLMALERGEFDQARAQLREVSRLDEPALAIKGKLSLIVALAEDESRFAEAVDGARTLAADVEQAGYLPPRTRAEALTVAGQVLAASDDAGGLDLLGRALTLWEVVPDSAFNRDVCELDYARALAAAGRGDEARQHLKAVTARLGEAADPQIQRGARELAGQLDANEASGRR